MNFTTNRNTAFTFFAAARTIRLLAVQTLMILLMAAYQLPVFAGEIKSSPKESACEQSKTWEICQKEADQGDATAQLILAFLYWQGREDMTEEDSNAEAIKWIKKAARQGSLKAQAALGMLYGYGELVPQDAAMAVMWLRKAAAQGDRSSQNELLRIWHIRPAEEADLSQSQTCQRADMDEDSTETRNRCQQAAAQGNAAAQYYVGWMYYQGYGVTQDNESALKWFTKAAGQGHAAAQYYAGLMYYLGEGLGPEPNNDYAIAARMAEAAKWFARSANQGDVYAQLQLGVMYRRGEGVERNDAKGIALIKSAAEQGDPNAQYTLGGIYSHGEGVAKNKTEAVKWYKKAAQQGLIYAKEALDRMGHDDDE